MRGGESWGAGAPAGHCEDLAYPVKDGQPLWSQQTSGQAAPSHRASAPRLSSRWSRPQVVPQGTEGSLGPSWATRPSMRGLTVPDPTGQICPLSLSLWSPCPSPLPPREVTRQLLGDTDPTCPDLLIPCFPPPHTLQTGEENTGCPRMGGWRGLMAAGHLRPPPERATDSLPRAGLPIPAGTEPTSRPRQGALQAKDVSALINELAI